MIDISDIGNINSIVNNIVYGDALSLVKKIPDNFVDMVCTSPPYWQQRDYGCDGQYGLESNLADYINNMYNLFFEIKRILKPEGTIWINMGDSFNENSGGYYEDPSGESICIGKNKIKTNKYQKEFPRRSLLLIPYRFAIKMIDDGDLLCRNVIIWRKNIAQPTTAENRFTIDYEPFFLFSKKQKYYFNKEKVKWIKNKSSDIFEKDELRERRSVWDLNSENTNKIKHRAPYPTDLVRIPILASCPPGGIVFDPFLGSGTTALEAKKLGFNFIGCDLNKEYCLSAEKRISEVVLG